MPALSSRLYKGWQSNHKLVHTPAHVRTEYDNKDYGYHWRPVSSMYVQSWGSHTLNHWLMVMYLGVARHADKNRDTLRSLGDAQYSQPQNSRVRWHLPHLMVHACGTSSSYHCASVRCSSFFDYAIWTASRYHYTSAPYYHGTFGRAPPLDIKLWALHQADTLITFSVMMRKRCFPKRLAFVTRCRCVQLTWLFAKPTALIP